MEDFLFKLKTLSGTQILIITITVVFIFGIFYNVVATGMLFEPLALLFNDGSDYFIYRFSTNPSLIENGEIYRLITAVFVHAGLLHLIFNLYALKVTGEIIEYAFGLKKLVFIFFIGGVGVNLLRFLGYLFFPNNLSSNLGLASPSVGASGAIFVMLGYIFAKKLRERDMMMNGININVDLNSLIIVIIVNLFIGFSVPQIDNFSHISGLLLGFAYGYLMN